MPDSRPLEHINEEDEQLGRNITPERCLWGWGGGGGGGGGEKSADMGPCGLCRRKRRDWPSLKYMLRKGEQQEEMLYIYM